MSNKKKFIAFINIIDNYYHSFCGREDICVDSWQEAESYCDNNSWAGEYYMLDYIMDRETKTFINTEAEFTNFTVEDDLKHNRAPTNIQLRSEWSYW